jgi:hypothetical protein
LNEPVNEPLVVSAAVTDAPGGTPGPGNSHAAVVCAGNPRVENVPGFPGDLMLFTLTPGAPKANAVCSEALEGRVMTSVYTVPLPVAEHVSPLDAWLVAPDVGTSAATNTNTPAVACNSFLIRPSFVRWLLVAKITLQVPDVDAPKPDT